MPTRLPPCPHCRDNLYVRVEKVLSGRRMSSAYYCGRCNKEWKVDSVPPPPHSERRNVERRRNLRDVVKAGV
jgi:uncharacterized protein YbaR (Trm112 family)